MPNHDSLRIVHISTVHPPFDQRIFHRECASLSLSGYDTHLLAQHDHPLDQVNGITLHSIGKVASPRLGLRAKQRLSRMWCALTLALHLDADLYHLHDLELIPVGLVIKWKTGKCVIFDCHEDNVAYIWQKIYINKLIRKAMIFVIKVLELLSSRVFDAIIVADRGVADVFHCRYKAKCVKVIHNYPRLDLFLYSGEDAVAKQPFDLVYHGTIPRYHLEIMFNVAEALLQRGARARWLLFGSCPESAWAQDELRRRGLADLFVIENRRIPHEQVAAHVRQAKVGIIPLPDLPKFQRNIPTKLFEYMALRMPVVLSDLPPSRPFVGDGKCAIMVPPNDYDAYADAIIRLLGDPVLRQEMGRIGQQRVREWYNWDTEAKVLLGLYADLLGVSKNGPATHH